MNRAPFLTPALEPIAAAASRIKSPRDYLRGVGGPAADTLPGNLLCFSRQRPGELSMRMKVRHHHHRFVLLASLKGSGRILLDAESRFLREAEVLLFFPFQYHSYMDLEPARICWLFVTFDLPRFASLEPLRNAPPRRLGPTELMLLSELLACWFQPARHSLLPLHLALLLARLAAQGKQGRAPAPAASAEAALLERLNAHLIPHLGKPLAIGEIASALGISESHLRARFRNATGSSLGRHLRDLRLGKACHLLHTTRLPVAEVAERCGFDSLYSFSRAFKSARGVSPREYRQISASPEPP